MIATAAMIFLTVRYVGLSRQIKLLNLLSPESGREAGRLENVALRPINKA